MSDIGDALAAKTQESIAAMRENVAQRQKDYDEAVAETRRAVALVIADPACVPTSDLVALLISASIMGAADEAGIAAIANELNLRIPTRVVEP